MSKNNLLFEEEFNSQQKEVLDLQDECKKTIKNTLRIAANANEISRFGATKLNEQTEQLSRIENETEKIKDNLDKTEEAIGSLKNPLLFWFKGLFRHNESSLYKNPEKKSKENKKDFYVYKDVFRTKNLDDDCEYQKKTQDKTALNSISYSNKGNFSKEIDDNLNQIGDLLKEMHGRALDMNTALKSQGGMMEKIHANVDNNSLRMKDQRKNLEKFI